MKPGNNGINITTL